MFCMLEEDGMTVEVMVDEVSYTFTCSIQGDIIGVENGSGLVRFEVSYLKIDRYIVNSMLLFKCCLCYS